MPIFLAEPSALVKLLQSPEKAALFITVVGGAIVTVIIKLVVGLNQSKREAAMAAVPKEVAPKLQPEGPPVATSHEADLQAMQARFASTDAVLIETQQALKRIRAAMDRQAMEAAHEEGALSSALVCERAENERLRAEVATLKQRAAELLAEMRTLRAEGPPEPPRPRDR
jgi:hypothetical protein